MIVTRDDELEQINDEIINISSLKELSHELIMDCITEQVENPFSSDANFVEQFNEQFEQLMEDNESDPDGIREVSDEATDFYQKVISMIDNKFNLEIDAGILGDLNYKGLKNVCDALYSFFIVNYGKNISKYMINVILEYNDSIVTEIVDNKKNKDVSTLGFKKKIDDKNFAVLLANINLAMKCAKSIYVDPEKFISYYNSDKFDVAVLQYTVDNMIVTGDFVSTFVKNVFGDIQDDTYDEVVADVQQGIYKKYMKSK